MLCPAEGAHCLEHHCSSLILKGSAEGCRPRGVLLRLATGELSGLWLLPTTCMSIVWASRWGVSDADYLFWPHLLLMKAAQTPPLHKAKKKPRATMLSRIVSRASYVVVSSPDAFGVSTVNFSLLGAYFADSMIYSKAGCKDLRSSVTHSRSLANCVPSDSNCSFFACWASSREKSSLRRSFTSSGFLLSVIFFLRSFCRDWSYIREWNISSSSTSLPFCRS